MYSRRDLGAWSWRHINRHVPSVRNEVSFADLALNRPALLRIRFQSETEGFSLRKGSRLGLKSVRSSICHFR